jgi:hypothetical protein
VAATLADLPAEHLLSPGGIINDSAIGYKFANIRTICHRLERTPFRASWIRTPGRMQNTFANECFSKRGNKYGRTLFIGARAVLAKPGSWAKFGLQGWLAAAAKRLHTITSRLRRLPTNSRALHGACSSRPFIRAKLRATVRFAPELTRPYEVHNVCFADSPFN